MSFGRFEQSTGTALVISSTHLSVQRVISTQSRPTKSSCC